MRCTRAAPLNECWAPESVATTAARRLNTSQYSHALLMHKLVPSPLPALQGQLGGVLTDVAPPCTGSAIACVPTSPAECPAECPPGRYLASGDRACALCPAGSSCAGSSAGPALCSAGQFSDCAGLPACRLCGVDEYQVHCWHVFALWCINLLLPGMVPCRCNLLPLAPCRQLQQRRLCSLPCRCGCAWQRAIPCCLPRTRSVNLPAVAGQRWRHRLPALPRLLLRSLCRL